ncbi:MAG: polymer-forming cytoskeletal protein [Pseudomonadota bacterium]|uniref:polymer-forming cytoskeletal protein n=1 Tax=Polaromonas sp. TaxID=1869339 RepID=UPI0017AA6F7C|nr:polymer-forming cytoskeletal protein [Polaromonas sp.]MBA3592478.1 polymer-forming cytoskeletal protein [Polaromonas sp.]MDQ3270850.1 polymer-forming cytoskeletal protein [Pseudomonadota bacterium]
MTQDYITYAAFVSICLLLLTLPFVPAFREWRQPTDFAALPISANYTTDIDHFARRLHADVSARLGQGEPTGYEDFEFVGDPDWSAGTELDWGKADKRLIARSSIASPLPIRSAQPVYVQGNLSAGAESVFPALYATGDIDLGEQSTVNDWAHADGIMRMGPRSVALRRVSAGSAIELGNETWFERLHAPALRFGSHASDGLPPLSAEQTPGSYADLPGAVQQTPLLFLIRGDCALPPARIYSGSLVVTGFLTVGAGTTVIGDVKAREGVSIGHRASVQGAVTCEKRVYVYKDARAWGPVVSESDILIGASALVGLPDVPTTVTASNIIVEDGVVVHGTVWAREIGMVKQA